MSEHNGTPSARRVCARAALALATLAPVAALAASRSAPSTRPVLLVSGPGLFNHPVRVVPSAAVRVPAGWPLDPNGAITCLTCHAALPSADAEGGWSLRDSRTGENHGAGFCVKCHGAGDSFAARSAHWQAMPRAHVRADADAEADSAGVGGYVDAESRQCLSCHDAVNAGDASTTTPSAMASFGSVGDPRRNHPIGVRYPMHARRGSDVPFRHASQLPREIRLPGGQVSCVSCHNLYAGTPKLLSVPVERSILCMTCHQME
ncbi:MAG: hypothetical protein HY763_04195 [Planctomycetes bacterium]|nr:hypothetical protein [Planctomycetota bacterium]